MRVPDYSTARFDGDRPASEAPDYDVVADCFICRGCSENRVDWLVWINDDVVECQTCGAHYDPSEV